MGDVQLLDRDVGRRRGLEIGRFDLRHDAVREAIPHGRRGVAVLSGRELEDGACHVRQRERAVAAALERGREQRAASGRLDGLKSLYATLSPREREVMTLVCAGRLNKQVAGELGLSEITVKIHRGSAMRKMGARTLADLVRMAEALGLAPE